MSKLVLFGSLATVAGAAPILLLFQTRTWNQTMKEKGVTAKGKIVRHYKGAVGGGG